MLQKYKPFSSSNFPITCLQFTGLWTNMASCLSCSIKCTAKYFITKMANVPIVRTHYSTASQLVCISTQLHMYILVYLLKSHMFLCFHAYFHKLHLIF